MPEGEKYLWMRHPWLRVRYADTIPPAPAADTEASMVAVSQESAASEPSARHLGKVSLMLEMARQEEYPALQQLRQAMHSLSPQRLPRLLPRPWRRWLSGAREDAESFTRAAHLLYCGDLPRLEALLTEMPSLATATSEVHLPLHGIHSSTISCCVNLPHCGCGRTERPCCRWSAPWSPRRLSVWSWPPSS